MMGAIMPGFQVAENPVGMERMSFGSREVFFVANQGRGGLEPGLAVVKRGVCFPMSVRSPFDPLNATNEPMILRKMP